MVILHFTFGLLRNEELEKQLLILATLLAYARGLRSGLKYFVLEHKICSRNFKCVVRLCEMELGVVGFWGKITCQT